MYTITALLACVTCSLWGWHKGAFNIALRLSVLLLAYSLAWQETPALAHWLAAQNLLPGVFAWPAAGLLLFVGGWLVFSLSASGLTKVAPDEWKDGGKKSGALLGAALGAALGVLAVWTVGALQGAWQLRQGEPGNPTVVAQTPLQQLDQQLKQRSGEAMASLASAALGDNPAAPLATQWLREPLSIGTQLQHLASKPELKLLFQEPDSYNVLTHGNIAAITQLPHFRALVTDPATMQLMQASGLPGQTDAERAASLAALLARYTRNFEALRNNAEFQALLADPELKEKLQQGQLLALVTNQKMRRIASLMSGDQVPDLPSSPAAPETAPDNPGTTEATESVHEKPLYRWRDEQGRLHITEKKPANGVQADVIQP